MRPLITIALAFLVGCIVSEASAGSPRPVIYQIASNYREIVKDFESEVFANRFYRGRERALADRLEDASDRFKSAAKDPRRVDRMLDRWEDIRRLQFEIEGRIVAPGVGLGGIAFYWQRVLASAAEVENELAFLTGGGGLGSGFGPGFGQGLGRQNFAPPAVIDPPPVVAKPGHRPGFDFRPRIDPRSGFGHRSPFRGDWPVPGIGHRGPDCAFGGVSGLGRGVVPSRGRYRW